MEGCRTNDLRINKCQNLAASMHYPIDFSHRFTCSVFHRFSFFFSFSLLSSLSHLIVSVYDSNHSPFPQKKNKKIVRCIFMAITVTSANLQMANIFFFIGTTTCHVIISLGGGGGFYYFIDNELRFHMKVRIFH